MFRLLAYPMRIGRFLLLSFVAVTVTPSAWGAEVSRVVEEGRERLEDNQKEQERVDKVHGETLSLIEQYEEKMKVVEGLHAYNDMMKRQIRRQKTEMEQIRESINEVSVIERQVAPLLMRMLDGMEEFIRLDIPFRLEERRQRVAKLREMMERVDVTVAEKARRVFEAYQIEAEYGRTIDSYRGKLALDGGVFDVDFLRIGRGVLMYRVVGNERVGYWDKTEELWIELDGSQANRHFEQGLKVARRETAPELITAPVVHTGDR